MSRIGKKEIILPSGVQVTITGSLVEVKGPKGVLQVTVTPMVMVAQEADHLNVTVKNPEGIKDRAQWGLMRTLIANAVKGVTDGFSRQLEINGVGFKATVEGKILVLKVGFSHLVNFSIPEGIQIVVEKNTITVTGIDKHLVGQVAANIRAIKKPEPYKGKGIKYSDEVVRRKAGKLAKAGAK
ncbi:MAG: 50S ribosomal protein L6 [Candidatus Komeilibacteria bacterium]|nr:50S ribosomal protein L6 [Candidatus Komeilibacteria bacterium]